MTDLAVADGLALPPDAVTQSFALLAVRRAGKSNTAAVIAEEMHAAGLPWVAIDPKGDWWGLRSSKDGTGPGLPVPVLGGLHGDVPLTPEAGKLIAELIAEANLTCILDVSDFPSKAAQMRFLTDFAEHLFRLHRKRPHPRHVFLEEADEYLPQRVMQDQAKCVGAWTKLVKQGGAFGLGVTLISQRSAVVNKDALTQVETLIALRTTSPQDRAAIKAWVDYHDQGREIVDSLPGLEDGEAWIVSPHWLARHGQPAIRRARFRQRATFDSGATPTMATASQRPATLADIDLGAILDRMEAVAEQAANDDPAALRRRITALERQLASRPDGEITRLQQQVRELTAELAEARNRLPERIEVPVVDAASQAAVDQLTVTLRNVAGELEAALSRVTQLPARTPAPVPAGKPTRAAVPREPAVPAEPEPVLAAESAGQQRPLKAGSRSMLEQLARHHPLKMTRSQLAALAGIKGSGSTFSSYYSALRINGYVRSEGSFAVITEEGLAAVGAAAGELPPAPEEIRAKWRGVLKAGARSILDHLIDRYPEPVSRADLGALAGINPVGSTLSSYLSVLRSNNLITEDRDGITASDVFFLTETADDA